MDVEPASRGRTLEHGRADAAAIALCAKASKPKHPPAASASMDRGPCAEEGARPTSKHGSPAAHDGDGEQKRAYARHGRHAGGVPRADVLVEDG